MSYHRATVAAPAAHPLDFDASAGGGAEPGPNNAVAHIEEKRTSLLDVVRDGLARTGKTTMLYRVTFCGSVAEGAEKSEIGAHYQKFFKQIQNETDLITGLLVVLDTTWVQVLEATSKVIYTVLRDLHRSSSSPISSITTNVKVLMIQDDIPNRAYPFWASRNNEAKSTGPMDPDAEDPVDAAVIAGVCVGLCGIGGKLGTLTKADLKTALDDVGTHFQDLLPRASVLERIATSNKVMGIDEWLELFANHLNPVLESELVWPAQQTLVF
ncbi:uncharacterized protein EV422DRAFT_532677 [Fimicolochytrium jonesii]|uniref:uncharacterized protein n=1 Tax=Fimicolochytrium jonesii TaxID=1396493 RepID=UPI0022FDEA72|nr:uncharacterized protein EV422DRAFT_532677 [Fimicolochytrium jonesii]KAI8819896.1 hypothetical protein EV422DRAFT_532677 [Fimicolochytrium jonesii]